jgi:cobalt-zinc-cadmium efflux system outer membrane protein
MHKGILAALIFLASSCFAGQQPRSFVSDSEGLSFAELAQTALTRNKGLEAARESLRQNEARVIQAGLRPNPSIEVSRTTDVMFADDGDTGLSVMVAQPLELGGKRSKRVRVEELAAEVRKAEIADGERQLLGRLRSLYVEALGAATRLDLFDRLDRLNQQTIRVMDVRLQAGDASRLDTRLLAAQTNQIRADRLTAENQLAGTLLQIRSLGGFSSTEPVVLKRESSSMELRQAGDVLISQALENRPDLRAARLREQLAEAGIVLAKSQVVPDATVFARYGRESLPTLSLPGQRRFEQENVMEFGVSVALPLFNREQGNVAEAASRRLQARSEREALELTIRQEVLLALARYNTAQRTIEILETGILQPNQESSRIIQVAYNLGEMRLLDFVNQQRVVVETETSYAAAQTDLNAALADLELATGMRLH